MGESASEEREGAGAGVRGEALSPVVGESAVFCAWGPGVPVCGEGEVGEGEVEWWGYGGGDGEGGVEAGAETSGAFGVAEEEICWPGAVDGAGGGDVVS